MKQPVELRLADDEALFGGKSVQLGASLRGGLPVPPGWALSVDFVDAIVNGDAAALASLEAFLRDKPEPFAVRSSGVGEDAKIASFAGQHFTELNRIGFADIVRPSISVWESGHSEGARAYRAKLAHHRKTAHRRDLAEDGVPRLRRRDVHPPSGDRRRRDRHRGVVGPGRGDCRRAWSFPTISALARTARSAKGRAGTKDVFIRALPGGGVEEARDRRPGKDQRLFA